MCQYDFLYESYMAGNDKVETWDNKRNMPHMSLLL